MQLSGAADDFYEVIFPQMYFLLFSEIHCEILQKAF